MSDDPSVGDFIKVRLLGEAPWAVVREHIGEGRLMAEIDNDLTATNKHGLKCGDVVEFEYREGVWAACNSALH